MVEIDLAIHRYALGLVSLLLDLLFEARGVLKIYLLVVQHAVEHGELGGSLIDQGLELHVYFGLRHLGGDKGLYGYVHLGYLLSRL